MTLEIVALVAFIAFITSGASLWAFGYTLHNHKRRIVEISNRLNYLEIGMHYHDLLPMPWETDDLCSRDTKSLKQEGNVVYLQKEE
jgi:hypothetical protein